MARIKSVPGNSWELLSGGGCLMLFGLPFFLAGIGLIAAVFGVFPGEFNDNGAPPFVGVLFGLLFAGAGACLIFGRRGVRIDSIRNTVTTWWGLWVPFREKKSELARYDCVRVTREIRQSGGKNNHTKTVYPVRLSGAGDTINLTEAASYVEARRIAEDLANFTRLRMEDSSSGETVVRDPDELDMSLRERARKQREHVDVPPLPTDSGIHFQDSGDRVEIDLPRRSPGLEAMIMIPVVVIFLLLVGVFFLLPMLRDPSMPHALKIALTVFLLLFMFAPVAMLIKFMRPVTERIVASSSGLVIEHGGLFGRSVIEIPADEIEELVSPQTSVPDMEEIPARLRGVIKSFVKTPGITANSDKVTAQFGVGLSPQEIAWLHAVVKARLTA